MKSSAPRLGMAVLILSLLPVPAGAQAQDGAESGVEAGSGPEGVESIEIVGEKIDVTDVQDEAQAITAFSAEDLDRANIQSVDSLAFNVPGLHVGQSNQEAIVTLRGVGTENASITGEPGVAFHVDGINYGQPSAARVAFFDLESLDVKRGPQGFLGGKNSTSGSINLITRKPGDEYEVTGDVLFGNYDRVRIRGAVNIPLGEHLALRTAYFREDRDGYLDHVELSDSRDPFDADDVGLRQHLRFTPTDSLDVLLSWNWFSQKGNGPQGDLVPVPKTVDCLASGPVETVMPLGYVCFPVVTPGRIDLTTNPPTFVPGEVLILSADEDASPRKINTQTRSSQDNRFWGWGSTVNWDMPVLPLLGETRIKALGGFQKVDTSFVWDFDATALPVNEIDSARVTEQYSSELQWSGALLGERLEWQATGFFSREKGVQETGVPSLKTADGATPLQGALNTRVLQETENKAYGAALHTTLALTDTIRFELGGRWIKDIKRVMLLRENDGSPLFGQFVGCQGELPLAGRNQLAVPPPKCMRTYRGTMWGSSIDWRPFGGDHLLYAKIDRGYKAGGFRSGRRGEYVPEKIWAYALGTKSELFDRRLQINLEGFFYAYEDMQLVVIDGISVRTENTDTRMYGWDLELNANPLSGLTLGGIVSYLKTETRDYFTLDPASTEILSAPIPGVDPVDDLEGIRNFNQRRLQIRDLTDDRAERGQPGDFAAQPFCFRSPREADIRLGPIAPCGATTPFGGLDDFSGNQLSRAPEWKYTLWAEYEIPLGRFGTLTPRVQYTWQDDTFYRVFNRDFDIQEDHHLTDAKLIWRSPEEVFEVEAFVQNIEDEAPKTNILVGPRTTGAPPLAWWGPPRFYGVRFGFRY